MTCSNFAFFQGNFRLMLVTVSNVSGILKTEKEDPSFNVAGGGCGYFAFWIIKEEKISQSRWLCLLTRSRAIYGNSEDIQDEIGNRAPPLSVTMMWASYSILISTKLIWPDFKIQTTADEAVAHRATFSNNKRHHQGTNRQQIRDSDRIIDDLVEE